MKHGFPAPVQAAKREEKTAWRAAGCCWLPWGRLAAGDDGGEENVVGRRVGTSGGFSSGAVGDAVGAAGGAGARVGGGVIVGAGAGAGKGAGGGAGGGAGEAGGGSSGGMIVVRTSGERVCGKVPIIPVYAKKLLGLSFGLRHLRAWSGCPSLATFFDKCDSLFTFYGGEFFNELVGVPDNFTIARYDGVQRRMPSDHTANTLAPWWIVAVFGPVNEQ